MTNQRLKKGEAQKIVLEAIDDKWKSRKEIEKETGLGYTTIDEALKALLPNKVEKTENFDMDGNKKIKFRSKITHNALYAEHLKLLVEHYNSGVKEKYNRACREMIDLMYNSDKKIIDKDFIDFVIRERLKDHSTIESGYDGGTANFHYIGPGETHIIEWDDFFFELFSGLIHKLKKDIDINPEKAEKSKELLDYVKSKTVDIFKNIIYDDKNDLFNKSGALYTLDLLNYQGNYLIAFDLLKKDLKLKNFEMMKRIRNKFIILGSSSLYPTIESIIKSYYEIDAVDCKKRLWDAYDYQNDEKAKKKILKIIDKMEPCGMSLKRKNKNC